MSVVEELRQNDPAMKSIRIWLHFKTSDPALAQALEQNPFVRVIAMDLKGVQQTDWKSLLCVIATRANLEKVILFDASNVEDRTAPAGLVRAFLHAIQQNTAIRNVSLLFLRLPTEISTFVDNASAITSFKLHKCDMEPGEREQGVRSLAVAIQRNTNIERLELNNFEDSYTIPMLEGLRSNVSLKSFAFSPCVPFSDAASRAIISVISQPGSMLRCFEFEKGTSLEEVFTDIQCENLLQGIKKSKLERFRIGSIVNLRQLQTLTESIPSMKLKELEVVFWENENNNYDSDYDSDYEDEAEDEFDEETIMQDLIHAVKNNFSLRSVKVWLFGRDPDNDDKQTLEFYANRNESLDQWVDHPEKVERKVWPDALGLAERAGPSALFRGLRSVLERDYGSLPGGRKRKCCSTAPQPGSWN